MLSGVIHASVPAQAKVRPEMAPRGAHAMPVQVPALPATSDGSPTVGNTPSAHSGMVTEAHPTAASETPMPAILPGASLPKAISITPLLSSSNPRKRSRLFVGEFEALAPVDKGIFRNLLDFRIAIAVAVAVYKFECGSSGC